MLLRKHSWNFLKLMNSILSLWLQSLTDLLLTTLYLSFLRLSCGIYLSLWLPKPLRHFPYFVLLYAEFYFPNLECNPAFPSFPCWGLSFTNQIYSYKILIWKESMWGNGLLRWFSGKRIRLPSRRYGFDPRVGKSLWKKKWQHTPVILSGKSHGQRSLTG